MTKEQMSPERQLIWWMIQSGPLFCSFNPDSIVMKYNKQKKWRVSTAAKFCHHMAHLLWGALMW